MRGSCAKQNFRAHSKATDTQFMQVYTFFKRADKKKKIKHTAAAEGCIMYDTWSLRKKLTPIAVKKLT